MDNIKDKALQYLDLGLSVIPINQDKSPALRSWKPYQLEKANVDDIGILFRDVHGIAIVCGEVSGGLEVIDVDTKHDSTNTLWREFSSKIPEELFSKLVVAQTRSGGYHLYYRCATIGRNNPDLARNNQRESLIETRGEGGYVLAYPSSGYGFIQGDLGSIPSILEADREELFNIARSFNQIEVIVKPTKAITTTKASSYSISPFDDYNQRGDVIALLESKGWNVVGEQGDRIILLRPGQTDSKTSGNFHNELRVLKVFSSSTEFDTERAYNPSQVFSILEGNLDNKQTYEKLLELGYGERFKAISYVESNTSYIDTFKSSLSNYHQNNLVQYLINRFGKEKTIQALKKYYIGTSTQYEGATIFWRIDQDGSVSNGKRILIDKENAYYTNTDSLNSDERILFGEHLLSNTSLPIGIVHEEVSAIICSIIYPQYIWVASGGLEVEEFERHKAFSGGDATIFTDEGILFLE
jgi:hypothetical protein